MCIPYHAFSKVALVTLVEWMTTLRLTITLCPQTRWMISSAKVANNNEQIMWDN